MSWRSVTRKLFARSGPMASTDCAAISCTDVLALQEGDALVAVHPAKPLDYAAPLAPRGGLHHAKRR